MIQVYIHNVKGVWFAVACAEQQFVATSFADIKQKALNSVLSNLPFNVPFEVMLTSPSVYAQKMFALLEDMLEGKSVTCSLNLTTDQLPEYTLRVLLAVLLVPIGYVATYGGVAKAVGGGPRAVGNIMASNKFAPVIPCHRVVKSDFSLGGYGGGLKVKYELLMKEKRGYTEHKDILLKDGGVLRVYPVEVVLKETFLF